MPGSAVLKGLKELALTNGKRSFGESHGTFLFCQAVGKVMIQQGGKIINMTLEQ
jgi:hypothetical protein